MRITRLKTMLLVILTGMLTVVSSSAQEQQAMPQIPIDANVRIGVLDNGLTYYIRQNKKPEGQAFFYIAQKVGSILEEENQRGLAHFLEHMCFNGTEKFPGNGLIKYLEKIGVQFGGDLNAYTSIDETVYNIDRVPVSTPGAIDSCLWILHDWADGLLLTDSDIDEERGVIHEEWRTRQNATIRIYTEVLPEIYGKNRYGHRLPIGLIDVIDNFPYQAIRDYYETWYRPDQQGIVVVGDINVDEMEGKIKSIFSSIPKPVNPKERTYIQIENNKEPIVSIAKDKEMNVVSLDVFNKHDAVLPEEKKTMDYLIYDYSAAMIANMFSTRFQEMLQKADAPFINASAGDGEFFLSKTKYAFSGSATLKEDNIEQGTKSLIREMLRAARYGFTASEYERAKAVYLRAMETQYNERANTQSAQYVNSYIRHFIDGEPIPGIEQEYALMNQLAPAITVDVINQVLGSIVCDSNWVMVLTGPDKENLKYPSEEDMKRYLSEVFSEDIEPYVDAVSDKPLMSELPESGKILKSKKGMFGSTELTLSNGTKVIIKPTDFKQDEIQMYAFSRGGNSLFEDGDYLNFSYLNEVVSLGGVGEFSAIDLQKVLAGKKARAGSSIAGAKESLSGSCSPRDFETMMQLMYLRFTSPRQDQDAYKSFITRTKATLQNQELQPQITLIDSLRFALYGTHPRVQRIKSDMIDKLDYDRIMELQKSRFTDASGFTFILVGNVNIDSVVPMIERYIGGLPTSKSVHKENVKTMPFFTYGVDNIAFDKKMETPLATAVLVYSGDIKYNLKNSIMMSLLSQTLQVVYTEEIREKEGGSYGVGTDGTVSYLPKQQYNFLISFDTDPARGQELIKLAEDIFAKYAVDGPTEENLNKIKEYLLKSHKENIKENSYWMNVMSEKCWTGVDLDTEYEKILNDITTEDIRDFTKYILKQNNVKSILMTGIGE